MTTAIMEQQKTPTFLEHLQEQYQLVKDQHIDFIENRLISKGSQYCKYYSTPMTVPEIRAVIDTIIGMAETCTQEQMSTETPEEIPAETYNKTIQKQAEPAIPDFTQPPPIHEPVRPSQVDQSAVVVPEAPQPKPKRITKATLAAAKIKLRILTYLEFVPGTWVSVNDIMAIWKDQPKEYQRSRRAIADFMEQLFTGGKLERKKQYQKIKGTKYSTERFLYQLKP